MFGERMEKMLHISTEQQGVRLSKEWCGILITHLRPFQSQREDVVKARHFRGFTHYLRSQVGPVNVVDIGVCVCGRIFKRNEFIHPNHNQPSCFLLSPPGSSNTNYYLDTSSSFEPPHFHSPAWFVTVTAADGRNVSFLWLVILSHPS